MNRKSFYILGVIVMVMSMILAACAPAAAPTTAPTNPPAATNPPEPTEAPATTAPEPTQPPAALLRRPQATEAATQAPASNFQGQKYEAPNCDYGGLFTSIEAVDENTVKFTMCVPDPAFPAKIAFTSFSIQPQAWLEKTGGGGQGSELLEKPIGTGPYMVERVEAR